MAAPKIKTRKIYTPKESFTIDLDGAPALFRAGITTVAEGHPVLKGRMDLFREVEVDYDWEGQTATSRRS